MIKLENVTIYKADRYFMKDIRLMRNEEKDFLKKYDISDFGTLENVINSSISVPEYLIDLYELAQAKLKRNRLDRDPEIYITSFPLTSGIDRETVLKTEEETKCNALILENPITCSGFHASFRKIKKESISNVRFLLGHTSLDGENSLKLFLSIGNAKIKKMLDAIRWYEEQVVRQASGQNITGTNLFYLNESKKREIVEAQFDDFIKYFLSISDDFNFIWGNKTKTVTQLLNDCLGNYSLIINPTIAKIIRRELTNIFINYMTLEELENDAIKNHTLDRFILEKSPSKSVK